MTNVLSTATALLLGSTMLVSSVHAGDDGLAELKKVMQSQMELMKPELQTKVKGLSTDTKMSLMAILAMHSRVSDKATMRQVMLEVMQDFQTVSMGIMTGSPEMTGSIIWINPTCEKLAGNLSVKKGKSRAYK